MNEVVSLILASEGSKKIQEKIIESFAELFKNLNQHRDTQDILSTLAPLVYEHEEIILEKITDRYMKFRTLLSRYVDVHIADIYQPLKIKSRTDKSELKIDDNITLQLPKITCIIGKAGQGKTTLLKKIFLNTINHKFGIFPLIITLRNINYEKTPSIEDIVIDEFQSIGFELSKEQCTCLLAMKRIRLLFDGFDEVPDSHGQKALNIITSAYYKFGLDCIVTSRPGTEVTREPGISNYDLLDLNRDDILRLIKNHPEIQPCDKEIFNNVIENKSYIAEILITPILVDIFCSTYNSLSVDPKTLTDFYNELFKALASTHDRLKTYYERHSKTGLDNATLELIMHSASFRLLELRNDVTFKREELSSAFNSASERLLIGIKDTHIDIINKTSLIKDEELTYSYLHKSIIEFFSAKYISQLPDEAKRKFYKHAINNYKSSYENVLKILHKIDCEYFYLYFAKDIYDSLFQSKHFSEFNENNKINDLIIMVILRINTFECVRNSFGMNTEVKGFQSINTGSEQDIFLGHKLDILLQSTEMNYSNDDIKTIVLELLNIISKEVKNNNDILKSISTHIKHTLKESGNTSTYLVSVEKLINSEISSELKSRFINHAQSINNILSIINDNINKHKITHENKSSLDMLNL